MDAISAALDPPRLSRRSPRLIAFLEKPAAERDAAMEAAQQAPYLQTHWATNPLPRHFSSQSCVANKDKATGATTHSGSAAAKMLERRDSAQSDAGSGEQDQLDGQQNGADESQMDLETHLGKSFMGLFRWT